MDTSTAPNDYYREDIDIFVRKLQNIDRSLFVLAAEYCKEVDFVMIQSLLITLKIMKEYNGKIKTCPINIALNNTCDFIPSHFSVLPFTDREFAPNEKIYANTVGTIANLYIPHINKVLNSVIRSPNVNTLDYYIINKFDCVKGDFKTIEDKLEYWRKIFGSVKTHAITISILNMLIYRSTERHVLHGQIVGEVYRDINIILAMFKYMVDKPMNNDMLEKLYDLAESYFFIICQYHIMKAIFIEQQCVNACDSPLSTSYFNYHSPIIYYDTLKDKYYTDDESTEIFFNYWGDDEDSSIKIATNITSAKDICQYMNDISDTVSSNADKIQDICKKLCDLGG